MCGPKRHDMTQGWSKLHGEKLHNYIHQMLLGDQIKEDDMYGRDESCI